MRLIVGLGNKGNEYENTRHNIGFMVLDKFLENKNLVPKQKFDGIYYELNNNEEKIFLLKPQKYINLSGEVIKKYVDYYKIPIENILIVQDDLDTPVGSIKIKPSGGSGGHNGLKDIESNLKTKNYKRIKLGISNIKSMDTKDYVLGKFSKEDQKIIDFSINKTVDILNDYLVLDFEKLMNKYN